VKTILLVDDEADVRSVLKMRLERSGYRVLESETGTHALKVVQESHPDLMVLDWKLPGLTGIEVLRKIRANPLAADLIVFMVTGMDEMEVRRELQSLDVSAVIEKPFDPGSVSRKIDDALGGSPS
jgi:CheY-like chemotaxis protein